MIVGIVLGVVLLCCGGGVAAVLFVDDGAEPGAAGGQQSTAPSTRAPTPKGGPTPEDDATPPDEESIKGDLDRFKKGDCLTIDEATDEVDEVGCGTRGALKVLLRKDGTISESACSATDYTQYLYQDGAVGTLQDFILCVAPAR
ncbi:LppU/SCO3897 family protein [Plantactinospora sp. WMMB334]|uniref:LppU/SCO3897 family protein n=1 Tax=Plantactinospora sp. WMMB334 TaxID=3404119 RepID=UPI003B933650